MLMYNSYINYLYCLYCVYVREYYEYSLTANKVTSLAAAVRAPYLCVLPSASHLSAIG